MSVFQNPFTEALTRPWSEASCLRPCCDGKQTEWSPNCFWSVVPGEPKLKAASIGETGKCHHGKCGLGLCTTLTGVPEMGWGRDKPKDKSGGRSTLRRKSAYDVETHSPAVRKGAHYN